MGIEEHAISPSKLLKKIIDSYTNRFVLIVRRHGSGADKSISQ